jgi:hypothetical protein
MVEGALGGSNLAYNHARVPYEKSLLNDMHAALEYHRLHPGLRPTNVAHEAAGTARTRADLPTSTIRQRPVVAIENA